MADEKKIGYEKRALAFVDILGFKNIVNNVNNFEKIHKIATAIRNEKKLTDKMNENVEDHSFLETYFSDSLIMSTDLRFGGFYFLLKQVSFLMQLFAEYGLVARGGIAVGDLYHCGGIVFGPALVEAVSIEQNIAIYPRVVMTGETFEECLKIYDGINDLQTREAYLRGMVRNYKNEIEEEFFYVDYLSQRDDFDYEYDYIKLLKATKTIVEDAFKNVMEKHIREKYIWLKKYLCENLPNGLADYNAL